MNLTLVGTSRCDVPAREAAGGIIAPLSAARTAQRAVPTRFRVQCAKFSGRKSNSAVGFADKLSALRLLLELHDDPVGLLQRTSFNVSIHENDVRLAVGLMQPACVLVADIGLCQINDGRMVQEKRQIGNQ